MYLKFMEQNFEETVKDFWRKQEFYPDYGTTQDRKMYDAIYTRNEIKEADAKVVLDLGAGNGSLITILKEMTNVKEFFAFDLSKKMLDTIDFKRPGAVICPNEIDLFTDDYVLPFNDLTIFFGVAQYLPDEDLRRVLERISKSTDVMLFKTACSLSEREDINKYSEALDDQYACSYRTLWEYLKILNEYFDVTDVDRAYPDEIESKFGTKQFLITCKSKDE